MKWLIGVLMILVFVLIPPGCAYNKPYTSFKINPITRTISLYDSKDNDILIKGLSFDASKNSFVVKTVSIRNNSSDVIGANVAQMLAFAEQQRAANEGIAISMKGLASLVNEFGGSVERLVKALPDVKASGSIPGVGGVSIETGGGQ